MSTQPGERPATKRQLSTLRRLATMHNRLEPKPHITFDEASDAIRWLATRRRKGEEFAPVPEPDPELQPNLSLHGWRTARPGGKTAIGQAGSL